VLAAEGVFSDTPSLHKPLQRNAHVHVQGSPNEDGKGEEDGGSNERVRPPTWQ